MNRRVLALGLRPWVKYDRRAYSAQDGLARQFNVGHDGRAHGRPTSGCVRESDENQDHFFHPTKESTVTTNPIKRTTIKHQLQSPMPEEPTLSTEEGTVELMNITPQMATELLSRRHPYQRLLRATHVDALSDAMVRGTWRWVGDPIRLDTNGFVIDGQHRLSAVVKSGVTLKNAVVMVVHTKDAILSIDQSRPRTLVDMYATRGKGGGTLSRTVSGAIVAESTDWKGWRGMPREDQLAAIERCEFVQDLSNLTKNKGESNARATVSVGSLSGALRCMRTNREAAIRFFGAVFAMNPVIDGLEVEMVRVLYSFLAAAKKSGWSSEMVSIEQAHKSITAYNHWRSGKVVGHLQWKGGAPPVVVG